MDLANSLLLIYGLVIIILPARISAQECKVTPYTMEAYNYDGHCRQTITIDICSGWCISTEYPILDPPYTKTDHNICGYASYKEIEVVLTECDEGYEPESYHTINATSCGCQPVSHYYQETGEDDSNV